MNKRFLLALALFALPAWANDRNPRKRNHTVITFTQKELDEATPRRSADDDDYRNIYGCNRREENCCLKLIGVGALCATIYWSITKPFNSNSTPCNSGWTDFAARPTGSPYPEFNPEGSCLLAAKIDRLELLTECHKRNLDCTGLDALCGTVEDIAAQCYKSWKERGGH